MIKIPEISTKSPLKQQLTLKIIITKQEFIIITKSQLQLKNNRQNQNCLQKLHPRHRNPPNSITVSRTVLKVVQNKLRKTRRTL